ncbi:MAG: hypothetical protein A3G87_01690 [Omnitrophica bacterium RIFCSPLOWO2_12_FULL_50_11]|nr:MAG: hypothetical protein A3G87_01690 [Omnitrophica bacterium RIFCSPLOWO2_12_FULL_50_11]
MRVTRQISEQCLAARKNCVLFDHPNRGVIEVSGRDRVQFLHNILSSDVKSLQPGKGNPSCFLTAQAKIIASMNVLCFDEHLWLAMDYVLKDKVLEHLAQLIFTEEVILTDRSDTLKLISVHGPRAKDLLGDLFAAQAAQDVTAELLDHKSIAIGPVTAVVIRINIIAEIGYAFLIPKNQAGKVREEIESKGVPFGLATIQAEALETLRIEAGIPRYGIDFDESHIPLEARLNQTVSFTKGCFPGQEILARLDSRGGVSKKLVGLVIDGETIPQKNDRILTEGQEAGTVTSGAFSPALQKVIALGYVKKGFWDVGCEVAIQTQEKTVAAKVESLPFASRKS